MKRVNFQGELVEVETNEQQLNPPNMAPACGVNKGCPDGCYCTHIMDRNNRMFGKNV